MGVLYRPTTGTGLVDTLGTRFSIARCSLGGSYFETGVMSVREKGETNIVPTTAFLGYRYAYPGTKLMTGTIEGFGAALDDSGFSGSALQSNLPQTSTPISFNFIAGAFQISGTIILDEMDFSTGPNDVNVLRWNWVMAGNPTIRRIYGLTEAT